MNMVHLWAHQPELHRGLFDLVGKAVRGGELSFRQRALLVVAGASAAVHPLLLSCLGQQTDRRGRRRPRTTHVLRREDEPASSPPSVPWWGGPARSPGTRTAPGPRDVQELRDAGFDDGQIFAITVFVALRLAFATVNDALGALPDDELLATVPASVRHAVTYGRPAADADSSAQHRD